MTEEETFKRLQQSSFHDVYTEVVDAYVHDVHSYPSFEFYLQSSPRGAYILRKHYWTCEDFFKSFNGYGH